MRCFIYFCDWLATGLYGTPIHGNHLARDWMMVAKPDLKVIDLASLGLKQIPLLDSTCRGEKAARFLVDRMFDHLFPLSVKVA